MNKSYLVSGAGSGIGQAIALHLAERSDQNSVILLGRNKDKLEGTLNRLPRRTQHTVIAADLRDAAALKREFARHELTSRNLCGVIANAGIGGGNEYGDHDRWGEIIATNLTGTYQLIHEALSALKGSKQEYKHIVLISSILAKLGVPGYSAYCASKAGLLGLARSLAVEFARDKILVNAVCPGWVKTEMSDQGIEMIANASGISIDEAYQGQMQAVPLRKMSEPSEVAELVGYLSSPNQISITGQTFDINNGALMP